MRVIVFAGLAAVAFGLVAAKADAVSEIRRHPGAYCHPQNDATAVDISYGTIGQLTNNNASSSRTVICPVAAFAFMNGSDSLNVRAELSASTPCTFRTATTDGFFLFGTSQTASSVSLTLPGSDGVQTLTGNLRCALPPGATLFSVTVNITDN